MNFRDRVETNEAGDQFIFTVEMQRKLSEAGLPIEPASLSSLQFDQPPTPRPQRNQVQPRYNDSDEMQNDLQQADESTQQSFPELENIQIDPMTGKYIGRVKWYNVRKGYGFFVRGAGEEIFFHKSGTVGEPTDLKEGQLILYDVEETRKGPEAADIEPYQAHEEE